MPESNGPRSGPAPDRMPDVGSTILKGSEPWSSEAG